VFEIPEERLPGKKNFSFPCPQCKGMIHVDVAVKELPRGEALKEEILRKVTELPAMPQTVLKARQIMASEKSNFDELAQVLKADQAIASKLLKLSNSTYYGMRGKISSIQHASVVLGMKTLKEIIMLAGTSNMLAGTLKGYGLDAGDLWQHSLGTAFGAKLIAEKVSPELADDAFVAGLIHDCGKLVLDDPIFERRSLFTHYLETENQSFLMAEKSILGFDHTEIAYALCKKWNVPESLNTAIRYHHSPGLSDGDKMTEIIHMADAFAMMSGIGGGFDGLAYELDDQVMVRLNVKEADIPVFMAQMADAVTKVANPES
jgi:HD-like signal output (HDOD) protein